MSNNERWESAELFCQPDRLFILWLIDTGEYQTLVDLSKNVADCEPIVDNLLSRGFLSQAEGKFAVTNKGREALAYLGPEVSP